MAEIKNARMMERKFLLFDLFKSTSGNTEANNDSKRSVRGFNGSVRNLSK